MRHCSARHVKGTEGKERDPNWLKSLCVWCHQMGVSNARGKGNGFCSLRQGVFKEEERQTPGAISGDD